jgi:uncharacterized protein YdcH (DUF465 family)
MIIDSHYIESAIKIRKEYLGLNKELEMCSSKIKEISNLLMSETEMLDELKDNLSKYKTPEEAQEAIFEKLNDIDKHTKKINNIYNPINKKIEELEKQEYILYSNICRAYPELSQAQIIEEINNALEVNK